MAIAKRIFLFLAVNILVVVTLSLVTSVLGIRPYISAYGLNYEMLMYFCLVWGMGGAFISLGLSRLMAKWMMGVEVIDPNTRDPNLQNLVQTVYRLARGAGLPTMPEVGIYDSEEVNAFATGPSRSRSLVAVSAGLLGRMNRNELEGVLGHEISHISNGDMVTMTLVQGVVNAFVMFLARAVAFAIASMGRSRDQEGEGFSYLTYSLTVFVLEVLFMILGSVVVFWFSRQREYRADAGGARVAGREKMIQALQALKKTYELVDTNSQPALNTLKISGTGGGIMQLFATHPSLDQRIERLRMLA
jgi:heat shock protein HtpX